MFVSDCSLFGTVVSDVFGVCVSLLVVCFEKKSVIDLWARAALFVCRAPACSWVWESVLIWFVFQTVC